MGWLFSLGVPEHVWHVLMHVAHGAAIAGLAVAAVGLFRRSPRALLAGVAAQLPLLAVRGLRVPAYAALTVRPSVLGLMYPAAAPSPEDYGLIQFASGLSIAVTLLYGAYLLWLRRELRGMRT